MFVIASHNARSAHAHMEDLRADYDLPLCSVLFVNETQAKPGDPDAMYRLHDFHLTRANATADGCPSSAAGSRPFNGMFCYSKQRPVCTPTIRQTPGLDVMVVSVPDPTAPSQHITCCGVYCSDCLCNSTQMMQAVVHALNEHSRKMPSQATATFVAGNMNIDMRPDASGIVSPAGLALAATFNALGLQLVSDASLPTHEGGKHIDSIWGTVKGVGGISPAYWTDHSTSWCAIPLGVGMILIG